MLITESKLRKIVREIIEKDETLNEAAASARKTYIDSAGNKFQIRNGSLMLTARSSGKTGGLPIMIPANTLAATARVLGLRYPKDAALSTMAGKTSSSQSAGGGGSQIFPSLKRNFPLFDPAALGNRPVMIGVAGTPNCSEWVGNMLDTTIGNAWHAHNNPVLPSLKFDAYFNFSSYKSSVEKILKEMNKDKSLGPKNAEAWNDRAGAISKALIPPAGAIASVMSLGDVVGIFHQESSHHGEALFDGATACSLAKRFPPSVPPGALVDGRAPWDYSMLGQDKNFVVNRPFGLNTHVGFVGAIHNGRAIVCHNITGKVYACYADKMTSADFPMWVKQGKASAPSVLDNVPSAAEGLNVVSGGLKAARRYLGF